MKDYLKKTFALSEKGAKGLSKAIFSFVIYYFSFIPPMMLVLLFADKLLSASPLSSWTFLAFLLVATIVMYLIVNWNYRTTYDETYSESANLRIDLASKLSKLPLSYFSKHELSDLAQTIMADVATMEHALSHAVGDFIGFMIYFTIVGIMMTIMNWKLGLSTVLPVLAAAFIVFITRKKQIHEVNIHYGKMRQVAESFQSSIELNQEIQSYGLKDDTEARIDRELEESEKHQWKAQVYETYPAAIAQTITVLPIGITMAIGLAMLARGEVSLIIVLGYVIMAAKLGSSVIGILLYLMEIYYLDARIARIREIKEHETQGGKDTELSSFSVEVKDTVFSYDTGHKVIDHVSFRAEENQVTALVGPSGCGKSTMLKLISRLYDVDSGAVLIGGKDVSEISTDSLFRYISIVFQDVVLFNSTVMENIRIGRRTASDEEVMEAARLAGCDSFIGKLPDGYMTMIGENGTKLSGGERQRLSIARAILKDAPVIILDEIASALDVETEVEIQKSLNLLTRGKTVIVISHRLRSIENADRIVVMKDGKVESIGTHNELLRTSPTYRTMIEKSAAAESFNY